jgi:hypothetical protein
VGSRSEHGEAEDEVDGGEEESGSDEIDHTKQDVPILDRSLIGLTYEEGLDSLNLTRRERNSLYRSDSPAIPSIPSQSSQPRS